MNMVKEMNHYWEKGQAHSFSHDDARRGNIVASFQKVFWYFIFPVIGA